MIWKEKGVLQDSDMCFFSPSDIIRKYYCYMLSCGHYNCDSEYSVRRVGNRSPLFFYIVSGILKLEYQDKQYEASADDIVLINCYYPHHYYCNSNCEFLFFHFDGKEARTITNHLIEQNHSPVFHLNNATEIYKNISEPILRLCYQEQTTDTFLSALVYSTLCSIQAFNEILPSTASTSSDVITRVIDYMKSNIGQQLSLQLLSEEVNLSPYYLAHLFKKETGSSPIEYMANLKTNYAKLILRNTNMTISELAETLGYSSSSSFINAFKARRGLSPQKYREQISRKK